MKYNAEFWDDRFATENYVYGVKPNDYIAKKLSELNPGTVLFPAEGEGRNAIYAAQLGWHVYAFDISRMAMQKAKQLAERNNVSINYQLAGFATYQPPVTDLDVVVLCFTHQPEKQRKAFHSKVIQWVKPGGIIIIEAYAKEQINNDSGGPKELDMLYSKKILENDFNSCQAVSVIEEEIHLQEGNYHNGKANMVRAIIKK